MLRLFRPVQVVPVYNRGVASFQEIENLTVHFNWYAVLSCSHHCTHAYVRWRWLVHHLCVCVCFYLCSNFHFSSPRENLADPLHCLKFKNREYNCPTSIVFMTCHILCRYVYKLCAPTSVVQLQSEDTLTYLNKGILTRGMVNYSNRTYTCWQNPNRTVTANVCIIEDLDNWGSAVLLKGSSKNTSCGFNFLMEHTSVTTYSNWAVISCGSSLQWLSFVEAFYSLHQPLVCCSTWV